MCSYTSSSTGLGIQSIKCWPGHGLLACCTKVTQKRNQSPGVWMCLWYCERTHYLWSVFLQKLQGYRPGKSNIRALKHAITLMYEKIPVSLALGKSSEWGTSSKPKWKALEGLLEAFGPDTLILGEQRPRQGRFVVSSTGFSISMALACWTQRDLLFSQRHLRLQAQRQHLK